MSNRKQKKSQKSNGKVISMQEYKKQDNMRKDVNIIPQSKNQEDYLVSLNDDSKPIVISIGPAGCGKTMIATKWAIRLLLKNEIEKIVITRPTVAVDNQDIGFLPGDIQNKMQPWTMPILDVFKEYFKNEEIENMIQKETIEIAPMAYVRGRTFKNSVVIVDEAQSTTDNAMKSILTRIGENSKMVITGDLKQSDIGTNNGLGNFVELFEKNGKDESFIDIVYFDKSDIHRHNVVREVLNIYGEED